jgi:hypothetical protein
VAFTVGRFQPTSPAMKQMLFEFRVPFALNFLLLATCLVCWRMHLQLLTNLALAAEVLLVIFIYARVQFEAGGMGDARDRLCITAPVSVNTAVVLALWLMYAGTLYVHYAMSVHFLLWIVVFVTVTIGIKQCQDWVFVASIYWFVFAIGAQHKQLWLIIIGISVPVPFLLAETVMNVNLFLRLSNWTRNYQKRHV